MNVLDDGRKAPLPLRERGEYDRSANTFSCTLVTGKALHHRGV